MDKDELIEEGRKFSREIYKREYGEPEKKADIWICKRWEDVRLLDELMVSDICNECKKKVVKDTKVSDSISVVADIVCDVCAIKNHKEDIPEAMYKLLVLQSK